MIADRQSVAPAPQLVLDGLCVRRGDREVIRQCDQVFRAGAVHGVLGHNGAGKTTLFEAVFGFLAPESGSIALGGRPVTRADVAYLPTDLRLYDGITGEELLLLFAGSARLPESARTYAQALDVPRRAGGRVLIRNPSQAGARRGHPPRPRGSPAR